MSVLRVILEVAYFNLSVACEVLVNDVSGLDSKVMNGKVAYYKFKFKFIQLLLKHLLKSKDKRCQEDDHLSFLEIMIHLFHFLKI